MNSKSNLLVDKNSNIYPNKDFLLKQIGLMNLPNNIDINISKDGNYLTLKNIENDNHLLFQLPINEPSLEALENNKNYNKLICLYYKYKNDYINDILDYTIQERYFIQKNLPEVSCYTKIRIKSFKSYLEKINTNILEGKSPILNDLVGERIIITKVHDSTDPKLLSAYCYRVAELLYNFRENSYFKMRKNPDPNIANSEYKFLTKDYIKYPKENGYQSLHILLENENNNLEKMETQIRTSYMESNSKNLKDISEYKSKIFDAFPFFRVPQYYLIPDFNKVHLPYVKKQKKLNNNITELNEKAIPEINVFKPTRKKCFEHYYNSNLCNSSKRITYDEYLEELHNIEELIGTSLSDITKKLRLSNRNLKFNNIADNEKEELEI